MNSTQPALPQLKLDLPEMFMTRSCSVVGSTSVHSSEIAQSIPGWSAEDAIKRTGITTRVRADPTQTAVTMAKEKRPESSLTRSEISLRLPL